jgi:peptidoglycan/LPS O-acetylase OafA/YrhL
VDVARAVAALTVVIGHVRAFVFVDFTTTTGLGWTGKAFYFATGLGHQAVMVFFVLSGFLVGGGAYTAVADGRWSWPDYFIKRLTRLWVVLLPALVLTAVWDRIGMSVTNSPMYFGQLAATYHSTPSIDDQSKIYSLSTLIMNALFLQTTNLPGLGAIPTFGTNGPLWSLANEFWYYVVFPFLLVPLRLKRLNVLSRVLMLLGATGLVAIMPKSMMLFGLIWLMGVAVFALNRHFHFTRSTYIAIGWISVATLLVVLGISRTAEPTLGSDFLVGGAFSALLMSLARSKDAVGLVALVFRQVAKFSYTLYLTHFPLAAMLTCLLLQNRRLEPSPLAFLIFVAAVLVLSSYAYGISLVFENNTAAVQTYFKSLLFKRINPLAKPLEPEGGH